MGNLYLGAWVDLTIFRKELAHFNFSNLCVWVDLGFTGIKNDLPTQDIEIGYKRKKKQELADWQKLINYEIARVRIKVEHSIWGMKRYYILRNKIRLKNPVENKLMDASVEMCAALWNFRKAA